MKSRSHSSHDIKNDIKRTAGDSFIYIPSRIVPAIIGILLIRILTTIFSPEQYGFYQITLSTFGLIRVFSMIWLSASVTRLFMGYKNSNNQPIFLSTLFLSSVVSSLVVAFLVYLINATYFQSRLDPQLYHLINLAIAASVFNSIFEIFVTVYRAGLQPKKYTLHWLLFSVGKPLLGLALILLWDFGVEGIFWAFFMVPFVLEIVIFIDLGMIKTARWRNISSTLFKQFANYGPPISFSFLAFWMLSFSDRYLIEIFRETSEVGLYSVGYVISEKTLNFAYAILMLAAFPIIVDTWERRGREYTQELITELARYFLLLCTPILVLLVALPKHILLILASEKFIAGADVLPLIAIGIFFFGLNQYVLKGLELQKKSYKIALLALIAGFFNILFNIILIPKIGYIGAGISACSAYIIYFLFSFFVVKKELPFRLPFGIVRNILLAALLDIAILKLLGFAVEGLLVTLFVLIPVGILLFFAFLIVFKELKVSELINGAKYIKGMLRI